MATKERQQITLAEFQERLKAQGVEREDAAFRCPMCGTVQSMRTLIEAGAGASVDEVEKYIGFSCVGRWTHQLGPSEAREKHPGEGCNWTLGGLFKTHDLEVVTPDGATHPHFEPATPEEAQALASRAESGPNLEVGDVG